MFVRVLFSVARSDCQSRLVDEFLARSNTPRCQTFRDTAEVIAKVCMLGVGGERGSVAVLVIMLVVLLCDSRD